jgi:hypothetical protein
MTAIVPIITQAGLQASISAAQTGIAAKITHAAFGDYGYNVPVNSGGHATATALRNERERVGVQHAQKLSSTLVELGFVADGDLAFTVREFGFFLEDGTLFAIWSHPDTALAYKSQVAPLIMGFELSLVALPNGSVTFEASGPPLELLASGPLAAVARSLAQMQLEQLRQYDRLTALET